MVTVIGCGELMCEFLLGRFYRRLIQEPYENILETDKTFFTVKELSFWLDAFRSTFG
jgi:hypothetical protein